MSVAAPCTLDASRERTREGLTQYDIRTSYDLSDAIFTARDPRPDLLAMHAWAEECERRDRASAYVVALVNGFVEPSHARQLAIARSVVNFFAQCLEHQGELKTMFRAKAHRERRR